MNKQEIENKLEEIVLLEQGTDFSELLSIAKNSFNFALELAAEKAEGFRYDEAGQKQYDTKVDKQSILDLKL